MRSLSDEGQQSRQRLFWHCVRHAEKALDVELENLECCWQVALIFIHLKEDAAFRGTRDSSSRHREEKRQTTAA